MRALGIILLLAAGGCSSVPKAGPAPRPQVSVWTFDRPEDRLAASTGPAVLRYRDPAATGWGPRLTRFWKISELGLPPLPGGDAAVMALPPRGADQGYTVIHHSPPNGVFKAEGLVSNYTLVMDLLWPKESDATYRTLYQTDAENAGDGELFLKDAPGGGVGVGGSYQGSVPPDSWHRLAIAVQCALGIGGTGQIHKFIDGVFVGAYRTPGSGGRCRWALGPEFHLFTDGDGEAAKGYVSSLMFTDRFMTMEEVAALGGPSAAGAAVPGPAARPGGRRAGRRVEIVGHRGGSSCCAPEDTLSAIRQGFDAGADLVEIDIRLSADGVPILLHDEDVSRTTGGQGRSWELTLKELKRLDAGSWLRAEFAGERVPTLAEALAAAKGRGGVYLDIKSSKALPAIARALRVGGWRPDEVTLSANGTYPDSTQFREHLPGAKILFADLPPKVDAAALAELKAQGVTGFDVDEGLLKKEFVESAHAAGMTVSVYTVLDPDAMLRFIDMGVDAIETDFPAVLDALLPPRPLK